MKADQILEAGIKAMADRAASRDLPQERSMARTVKAYNALTGHNLSEHDGWLFLAIVKAARATAGKFNLDDYVDGAAYFALAGETGGGTPDPTAVIEAGWFPWYGGNVPIERRRLVVVRFRDGTIDKGAAGLYYWSHTGGAEDIVSYRLDK